MPLSRRFRFRFLAPAAGASRGGAAGGRPAGRSSGRGREHRSGHGARCPSAAASVRQRRLPGAGRAPAAAAGPAHRRAAVAGAAGRAAVHAGVAARRGGRGGGGRRGGGGGGGHQPCAALPGARRGLPGAVRAAASLQVPPEGALPQPAGQVRGGPGRVPGRLHRRLSARGCWRGPAQRCLRRAGGSGPCGGGGAFSRRSCAAPCPRARLPSAEPPVPAGAGASSVLAGPRSEAARAPRRGWALLRHVLAAPLLLIALTKRVCGSEKKVFLRENSVTLRLGAGAATASASRRGRLRAWGLSLASLCPPRSGGRLPWRLCSLIHVLSPLHFSQRRETQRLFSRLWGVVLPPRLTPQPGLCSPLPAHAAARKTLECFVLRLSV